MPLTQFDAQLLAASITSAPPLCRNHGRHLHITPAGSTLTALAWNDPAPIVRVWRDHTLLRAEHHAAPLSAPCFDDAGNLWVSAAGVILCNGVARDHGILHDLVADFRAIQRPDGLHLTHADGRDLLIDPQGGLAILAFADNTLHLVYEQLTGLEYRALDPSTFHIKHTQRIAHAFCFAPVLAIHQGRLLVTFLGESTRPDRRDGDTWKNSPWQRRMGMGGYIGLLTSSLDSPGTWQRHVVARSRQFAKPIWPLMRRFVYQTPQVDVRPRMEEFSAPALCLGPDGVPLLAWSDIQRRWIFAARILGDTVSAPFELRGPLEQLTGPPLLPRHCNIDPPLAMVTHSRTYLDCLTYPSRTVTQTRHIDFLQPDDLAQISGLELAVNQLQRHPDTVEKPLLPARQGGDHDHLGIAFSIRPDDRGWRAEALVLGLPRTTHREDDATSPDGLHWTRGRAFAAADSVLIDDEPLPANTLRITCIRDDSAPPTHRFKGLWQNKKLGAFGAWVPVYSADRVTWSTFQEDPAHLMCDEDLMIWHDPLDLPARRYKCCGNARGPSGRVLTQWSSPDALHWHDVRAHLDFQNPFGDTFYFCDNFPKGGADRIIVDAWAGPDDEDEIHGGYVFRDGDRLLCLYMKWSSDGHITCALATSRDGLNFARVANGATTLPLGAPGTWDSGRIATRNPPIQVGDTWYQHYTGCAWKHGMAGVGLAPHKNEHETAHFTPMQLGLATIPTRRWAHLRLTPDADRGELLTIPFTLTSPTNLYLDAALPTENKEQVQCEICSASTSHPLTNFTAAQCDPLTPSTRDQQITWQNRPLSTLPPGAYQIRTLLHHHRTHLYTLTLRAAPRRHNLHSRRFLSPVHHAHLQ